MPNLTLLFFLQVTFGGLKAFYDGRMRVKDKFLPGRRIDHGQILFDELLEQPHKGFRFAANGKGKLVRLVLPKT